MSKTLTPHIAQRPFIKLFVFFLKFVRKSYSFFANFTFFVGAGLAKKPIYRDFCLTLFAFRTIRIVSILIFRKTCKIFEFARKNSENYLNFFFSNSILTPIFRPPSFPPVIFLEPSFQESGVINLSSFFWHFRQTIKFL